MPTDGSPPTSTASAAIRPSISARNISDQPPDALEMRYEQHDNVIPYASERYRHIFPTRDRLVGTHTLRHCPAVHALRHGARFLALGADQACELGHDALVVP